MAAGYSLGKSQIVWVGWPQLNADLTHCVIFQPLEIREVKEIPQI